MRGAIWRQGPHQGAQKSTRTGWEDCRTSVAKLDSVTSRTFALGMIRFVLVKNYDMKIHNWIAKATSAAMRAPTASPALSDC